MYNTSNLDYTASRSQSLHRPVRYTPNATDSMVLDRKHLNDPAHAELRLALGRHPLLPQQLLIIRHESDLCDASVRAAVRPLGSARVFKAQLFGRMIVSHLAADDGHEDEYMAGSIPFTRDPTGSVLDAIDVTSSPLICGPSTSSTWIWAVSYLGLTWCRILLSIGGRNVSNSTQEDADHRGKRLRRPHERTSRHERTARYDNTGSSTSLWRVEGASYASGSIKYRHVGILSRNGTVEGHGEGQFSKGAASTVSFHPLPYATRTRRCVLLHARRAD